MRDAIGRLLSAPILNAVAWVAEKIRECAYADVEGSHYQFKTNPIDIIEGPDADRWLSLPNVRRSINDLPDSETLQRLYPNGVRRIGSTRPDRIEARALAALLAKAHNPKTRRFLLWLEREVIFPADKKASMGRR